MKMLKSLFLRSDGRVKSTLSPFQAFEVIKAVHDGTNTTPEEVEFSKVMEELGEGKCWTVFAKTNKIKAEEYYSKTLNKYFCILKTAPNFYRVGIEPWFMSRAFRDVTSAKEWLIQVKLYDFTRAKDIKLKLNREC